MKDTSAKWSQRLVQLGFLLFLIGLLTGLAVPAFALPRMGLSSHLEAIMNGLFLIGLGLVWPRLQLGAFAAGATFWLAIYGTFANWATTLLSAIWGAAGTMPLSGGGATGTAAQEIIIMVLLLSLSAAMILVCVLVLAGLRRA